MHMGNRLYFILIVIVSAFLLVGCGKSTRGTASDIATAQTLVDEATRVLTEALEKDENGTLKELIARAKGVMIIPAIGDVSFIFSIGGGNAIILANTDTGWTGPVFLSKGTVGFGAQAGISKQSGIMLYMHEDDIRYLLRTGGVLQGQARAIILSADYKGNETPEFYESGDVYFVGENSGLYAGIAIDGGGFSDRIGLNEVYTGVEGGGPLAILYKDGSMPDGAQKLRDMLAQAGIDGKKEIAFDGETKKDGTEVPSN